MVDGFLLLFVIHSWNEVGNPSEVGLNSAMNLVTKCSAITGLIILGNAFREWRWNPSLELVPRSQGLADWLDKHSEWVLRFSTALIKVSVRKEAGTALIQLLKFMKIVFPSSVSS